MQLKPEQIDAHLRKQLAAVYFISGDEPLRVMESADAVRAAAREQGYDEREVLTVQAGFDWDALTSQAGNLSLFSQRRIIDLRMPAGKPGAAGSKATQCVAPGAAGSRVLETLPPPRSRHQSDQALDQIPISSQNPHGNRCHSKPSHAPFQPARLRPRPKTLARRLAHAENHGPCLGGGRGQDDRLRVLLQSEDARVSLEDRPKVERRRSVLLH